MLPDELAEPGGVPPARLGNPGALRTERVDLVGECGDASDTNSG